VNCPRCGADNPDHSLFCGECGAPMAEKAPQRGTDALLAAAEDPVRCPACGAHNAAGAVFCATCRGVLSATPAGAPSGLQPRSEHKEAFAPAGRPHAELPKRCPSCGSPVYPGQARCPQCGADPVAAALSEAQMVPQDARGPILYEDRPIFEDLLTPTARPSRRGRPFLGLDDLIDLIVRFFFR